MSTRWLSWFQNDDGELFGETKNKFLREYFRVNMAHKMWLPQVTGTYKLYRFAPFVRGREWPTAMEFFQAMATLYDLNVQVHIRIPDVTAWELADWQRCAECLDMEYTPDGQMHWSLPYPVATWQDGEMVWKVPHIVLKRAGDQFVAEVKGLMPNPEAEQPLFYVQLCYEHGQLDVWSKDYDHGKLLICTKGTRYTGKPYEEGFIGDLSAAYSAAVECSELSYVTRRLHPKLLAICIITWKEKCKVSGDLEVELRAASGKLLASMILWSVDNTVARFEQLLLELGEKAGAESILVNATLAIEPITLQARLVRTKKD